MPVGFIRRIARQSFRTTYVAGVSSAPTLQDNWTVQETTTYVPATPANGAAAWGGTVADLDRELTATGSTHAALGALLTFITKPEANSLGQRGSFGGVVIKVIPTFAAGSACAIEVWSLKGAAWTKRRRVPLGRLVRSGDTIVLDLTGPVLDTLDVDAYWITLALDIGTETLTWVACHVYGICPNDPVTPDCPPGTPPADCDAPECGVDVTDWTCQSPPEETDPPDPFVFPPILVKIPNPTSYTHISLGYFHNCPRPTEIRMFFGELPSGGSVKVTVANANGVTFAEGVEQTIAAPGTMTWTVATGFHAQNAPATQALPPAAEAATTDFLFTRQLSASAFAVAGNLLDILLYFWTYDIAFIEVC